MKKSSLRVSRTRGAEPECVFSACVCLFPACGGWCHADIFQSSTSASKQCEQPALAVWNLTEGCIFRGQEGGGRHVRVREQESVMEKSSKCMSNTDIIASADTMSKPQFRPVVSLRVCSTHGSLAAKTAENSRCAMSRTRSSEDQGCADDAPFQDRFHLQELIFAHSEYFHRLALQRPLLNKADWCAPRTVAKCEDTLLRRAPVSAGSFLFFFFLDAACESLFSLYHFFSRTVFS